MRIFAILTLLLPLAACDAQSAARAAAVAQCSTSATVQGLEFGTPERNTFVASCIASILAVAIVEDAAQP